MNKHRENFKKTSKYKISNGRGASWKYVEHLEAEVDRLQRLAHMHQYPPKLSDAFITENDKNLGYVLIMDVESIPNGMTTSDISKIAKEEGVVYYTGETKPSVMHLGGDKHSHLKSVKFIKV